MPYSTVKAIYSDLVLTKRGAFHNMIEIFSPGVVGGEKIA
jgi:hypothetical protein